MADKVEVEIGGQSIYEIAHRIAHNILIAEQGTVMKAGRKTYLTAVYEAMDVLRGTPPK